MNTGPIPGVVIAGRYRLESLLGEGGMGSVWAATQLVTNRPVALKFLRSELTVNPELIRRFMREARAASAIQHPNVLKVHDVLQQEDGVPVMVMDLLVGESLDAKLSRDCVIPLPELCRLLLPVVSALGAAHATGIVHRDMKPDNIFLEQRQGVVVPRVLDFGIAKLTGNIAAETQSGGGALTRTGAMLGTPYYMAPEQAFGESNADHRVDIWSLGVILYECLTGIRPVDGENLGQILRVIMMGDIVPISQRAPQLPEDIRGLIDCMLGQKADARPNSMREVSTVLGRYTDIKAEAFGVPIPPAQTMDTSIVPADRTATSLAKTEATAVSPTSGRSTRIAAAAIGVLVLLTVPVGLLVAFRSAFDAVEPMAADATSASAIFVESVDAGDVSQDAAMDAAPKAAPRAAPKAAPNAAPDAAPDAVSDAAPGAAPDAAPGAVPGAVPDAAPDAAPDVPVVAASSSSSPSTLARTGEGHGRPPSAPPASKPPPSKDPPPEETTTPAPTKVPGGVVESTPF